MFNRYLISTDLDGTLLDHHDYSWKAAKPALAQCRILGIPIILNTSKNQVEAELLRSELDLDSPIVVENGAALLIPTSSLKNLDLAEKLSKQENTKVSLGAQNLRVVFGVERAVILDFIKRVRTDYAWQFEGFNDWTIEQLIQHTGLSEKAAVAAIEKRYSEPFIWNSSDDNLLEFQALAEDAGLRVMQGGRFYHLQGETDKAKPIQWLKQHVSLIIKSLNGNAEPKLICLGDNHNDVAMLNIADIPVCVRSPIAGFPPISSTQNVIYTDLEGPHGWNQAIQTIIA